MIKHKEGAPKRKFTLSRVRLKAGEKLPDPPGDCVEVFRVMPTGWAWHLKNMGNKEIVAVGESSATKADVLKRIRERAIYHGWPVYVEV